MLPIVGFSKQERNGHDNPGTTNHAGAGKGVPTQSNPIAILDIAPLVLQRLVIHVDWLMGRYVTAVIRGGFWGVQADRAKRRSRFTP